MQIKLLIDGGEMKPGPSLAQKIGPLGLNVGQIISQVNEATKDFKGLQVPVELDVDPKTKNVKVNVLSPPVSGLLKKELGIEKGSGMQEKMQVANASIEQIISVAKQKMQNLLCKDLKAAVKTVAGTCVSLGVLIENKPPTEIEKEIEEGKYDKEIKEELTEPSEEKKKDLAENFNKVQNQQQKLIKAEQAAKEAEESAPEEDATEIKK